MLCGLGGGTGLGLLCMEKNIVGRRSKVGIGSDRWRAGECGENVAGIELWPPKRINDVEAMQFVWTTAKFQGCLTTSRGTRRVFFFYGRTTDEERFSQRNTGAALVSLLLV